MGHSPAKPRYRALAVSLTLSLITLVAGVIWIESVTWSGAASRLLWPLSRLLFFITAGLALGQLIEASGWTRYLAFVAAPLFRFGHLGSRCSAAFTTAFFSGAAANAMLLGFYEEGKITRRELFLTNLVNQLPAFFLHLPTTFFIVVPLTGWAGGLYFILTFAAALLRTAAFLLYGHLRLPPHRAEQRATPAAAGWNRGRPGKPILEDLRRKLPVRLTGVIIFVVPIYVAVFMINAMGLFTFMQHWLAHFITTRFIPMEALSLVVLSFAAEFTSGFAAAGALLESGILTIKQTVMALLIGNIVAFPIRALRHQLPRYVGIFSPKMGTQLLLLGQGFRIVSLIMVGIVYWMVV
jgi:hypothetical protein